MLKKFGVVVFGFLLLISAVGRGAAIASEPANQSAFQVVVRAGLLGDNSPIAGAVVTVNGLAEPYITDETGATPVILVSPGTYTLHIDAKGWTGVDMEGVQLFAGGPVPVDAYLTKDSKRQHFKFTPPGGRSRPQTDSPGKKVHGSKAPGDVTIMEPIVNPFYAPSQIKACNDVGQSCQFIPTETLVKYSLYKEWGDATPSYNSSNWPLESLKAGAVAIRSWLYFNATAAYPACKHSDCSVWNSESDLVWQTFPPQSPTNYNTAVSVTAKQYAYYGTYYDSSSSTYRYAPILAMFADRVGDPSKDGSINADGSSNGKLYLRSHESSPDFYVDSYRPAGFAPGLSQKGSADWIRGFNCGGFWCKMNTYTEVLNHDYNNQISYGTANGG